MMWLLLLRAALAFAPPPPRIWPTPPPPADTSEQCCSCWVYTNPYSGEQYTTAPVWVRVPWWWWPSWSPPQQPAGAHDVDPSALSQSAARLSAIPGYDRRPHAVSIDGVLIRP